MRQRYFAGKREQGGVTENVIPPEPLSTKIRKPSYIASTETENATFVQCTINSLKVCALVDTGAAVTIIHSDTFRKLRTKDNRLQRANRPILGANSKPLDVCGTTTLEINLGGNIQQHEVYVCNDLAQELLLGADFLRTNNCVVDFSANVLVMKGQKIPMTYRHAPFVCHVGVATSTVIPARSMMNVMCKVENGSMWDQQCGVLEPREQFERRYSVGIIKVAATLKDGVIPVRMFNPDDKPRRIYRGSSVGEFYSLEEDCYLDNDDEGSCYSVFHTFASDSDRLNSDMESQPSNERQKMAELFTVKNPTISAEEKDAVYEILARHKKLFANGKQDLGEIRNVQHSIDTGDSPPIRVPRRRIPHHQRETARKEIAAMLDADVIEPSNSPWTAPIVMVKKKDGTVRFCIDYRELNQSTKRDVFPIPRCDEILEAMAGAAYFTHLDLVRGYWQVEVAKESREKTAFSTPEGHFQFKRMPFGLTNAPATFQRAMNSILNGLNWKDCLVYLDDVIVFANSLEEHNRRLDIVLQRLEDAGVKLNASKCHFLQENATILGHVVSRNGVCTDPEKIQALLKFPIPSDVSRLRTFLGCAGYYRHFVPHFAEIASPLYNLERKGTIFQWTKECQNAFDALKHHLTKSPVLAYPQFELPFIVDTDASETGVGAVLSQIQDGEERVIAYAAKSLTKPQRNYSTTRKELFALVWGLEHFEVYLLGKEFRARTDHKALRWLYNFKNPKGQVARWLERLAEFNFTIEHRAGRCHQNADALSRSQHSTTRGETEQSSACSVGSIEVNEDSSSWMGRWTKSEIALHQREDPAICKVIKWVENGSRPDRSEIPGANPILGSLWSQFNRLKLKDRLLFRSYESEDGQVEHLQLCVPRKMVKDILELLHDTPTAGHLGTQKTVERVVARFYWKGWRQDVEDYCRSCKVCGERNAPAKIPRGKLRTSASGYPMERVAMDVIGPLPKTMHGNRFILVVNDYFTKWPEAYAIPNHEAETIARKLVEEWISRYGVMQYLHTDQGREFESKIFQAMAKMLGVNKTRTTPYHPQSDGLVERCNRTLKDMLSKIISQNQTDWDLWIPHVLLAYRTAVHASTKITPHRLLFGREARIPVDLLVEGTDFLHVNFPDTSSYVQETKGRFHQTHEMAQRKLQQATKRYKDYYDSKSSGTPYKVGDKVWLFNSATRKGISKKLSRPWEGPYTIVKALSDVVYRIQRDGKDRKRVVVHFNRLKPCIMRDQSDTVSKSSGKISRTKCVRSKLRKTESTEVVQSSNEFYEEEDDDVWFVRGREHPRSRETQIPPTSSVHPERPEVPTASQDPAEVPTRSQAQVPSTIETRNQRTRERRQPAWMSDYHVGYLELRGN